MDVPRRIGRFTIQERIGDSPSSVVCKAFDEGLQSEAVVKLIQLADERFGLRCMRELERWQGLGVGGIQKVVEIGKLQGNAWYGAEPVEGGSLAAEIERRRASRERWTEKQVYQIGKKLAGALDTLHGFSIVHGNLKPANVLGRHDADLALTDLGLARATELAEIPAWVGGLPHYRHLSPDQLQGFKPLDVRSDLWQLGLVLYEVTTLIHPFENIESPQALLERTQEPIDPPEILVPGFDSKLSAAIMHCLAPDRERRFATVRDFLKSWARVTAKYQSLSDVPIAAMNPDAPAGRQTKKFTGQARRVSGHARVSQPLGPSVREIRPTPRWVQALAVLTAAAVVGAGGHWLWTHETVARMEGGFAQQPAFAGTRVSWRTNVACETALVVHDGPATRPVRNAKEGRTQKHSVVVTDLTPGHRYTIAPDLAGGTPPEPVALEAPLARPFQRVRLEGRGDDVAVAFTTPVKARSHARAVVEDKPVELALAADADTTHEGQFKSTCTARLKELQLEAEDLEGTRRTLAARELAGQVVEPLSAAAGSGPLADPQLTDAVTALDKASAGPLLADLAGVSSWLFESPEVPADLQSAAYQALQKLERALARGRKSLPPELGVLKVFQENPYLRGQVVPTGELARACEGAFKAPPTSPVTLLVQLGLFSHLKPGLFTSVAAKARVAYDPKPQAAEAGTGARAVVHLPLPPHGEYRTAQLAIAVSALPSDAMLVASAPELGEVVLYSPVARPGPPPGEQWIARQLPPRLANASLELTLRLEPLSEATPEPLQVLGALLVYR